MENQQTSKPEADSAEAQAWAQYESISRMVSALDVDYDRLQELKDAAENGHYICGWNSPGYLPDCEPSAFDDARDTREYLASSMRDDAAAYDPRENPEDGKICADLEGAADMLETLKTEKEEAEYGQTIGRFHYWIQYIPGKLADPEEQKELEELQEAAGDCESEEEAYQAIDEDPLSVEVRSGWTSPGEDMTPEEFRILLCFGGPNVEIRGDIDHRGDPCSPRIIYSWWGDSGSIYGFDSAVVLRYCSRFIFS